MCPRVILLTLVFLIGCRSREATSQPPAIRPPVLSHAQVTEKIERRILEKNPGTRATRTSDHTLALLFPDGIRAELKLDVGFALCGRHPQDCDAYVDKLVSLIRTDEDHGEDEDDDDGD